MGMPTESPPFMAFLALALVGVTALSPTEQNPSSRNDRRWRSLGNGEEGEALPLAKIPRHESNEINGSSIRGPSIDLW